MRKEKTRDKSMKPAKARSPDPHEAQLNQLVKVLRQRSKTRNVWNRGATKNSSLTRHAFATAQPHHQEAAPSMEEKNNETFTKNKRVVLTVQNEEAERG